MNTERRTSPRVQVPIDVVWHAASGQTVSRVTRIEDLSVSGCFLGSIAEVSPGERVRLEINLPPKHEHLSIDAEVVYCQPNIGLCVSSVSSARHSTPCVSSVSSARHSTPLAFR